MERWMFITAGSGDAGRVFRIWRRLPSYFYCVFAAAVFGEG
jgi:hypothetical protein